MTIETVYLFTQQSIIVSDHKEGVQIRPFLYASLLVFDQYSTPLSLLIGPHTHLLNTLLRVVMSFSYLHNDLIKIFEGVNNEPP